MRSAIRGAALTSHIPCTGAMPSRAPCRHASVAGASTRRPLGSTVSSMRANPSTTSPNSHKATDIMWCPWSNTSGPPAPVAAIACRHALLATGTCHAWLASPSTTFMRKCTGRPIAPSASKSCSIRTSGG